MTTLFCILSFFSDLADIFNAIWVLANEFPFYFLMAITAIIIAIYAIKHIHLPKFKTTIGDFFPIGSDLWEMFN